MGGLFAGKPSFTPARNWCGDVMLSACGIKYWI